MSNSSYDHRTGQRWSHDEDEFLRARASTDCSNMLDLARSLGRTEAQCRNRYQKVIKPNLVKGRWTVGEDQLVLNTVGEGVTRWSDVALRVPGRTAKQCRERWMNSLNPSLKKAPWSTSEDKLLLSLQRKRGKPESTFCTLPPLT